MSYDKKMISSKLDVLRSKRMQFMRDIDRIKRDNPQDKAHVAEKKRYLNDVEREIKKLERLMK